LNIYFFEGDKVSTVSTTFHDKSVKNEVLTLFAHQAPFRELPKIVGTPKGG